MALAWKKAAKQWKKDCEQGWDSYQDLGRIWGEDSERYEAIIDQLLKRIKQLEDEKKP